MGAARRCISGFFGGKGNAVEARRSSAWGLTGREGYRGSIRSARLFGELPVPLRRSYILRMMGSHVRGTRLGPGPGRPATYSS